MPSPLTKNADLARLLTVVGGLLAALALASWLVHWHLQGQLVMESTQPDAHVVGRDFLNFWLIGKAAWMPHPGALYDLQTYNDRLRGFIGQGDYLVQSFSYPPTMLLPFAPFGLMPYGAALITYLALGLLAVVFATRKAGFDQRYLILLLISPAALATFVSGQPAFFLTAAFLVGYAQMDKRPTLAGFLFGLLSLKPHFALLLPLLLIASRRWKILLMAALTTLAIVGITTALYGPIVWQQMQAMGAPVQQHIVEFPSKNVRAWMVTLYMDWRTAGLSFHQAMLGQLPGVLIGAVAVCWCFMKRRDTQWSLLLFTSACLLTSPYVMGYDLLAFTASLLLVLQTKPWPGRPWSAALLYFLPLLHFIAVAFEIPGMALLPLLALVISVRTLKTA